MCTALTLNRDNFYFGRTLDVEFEVTPEVVITPRQFPIFSIKEAEHNAMIGMALIVNNYPLYFDGTNEKGLSMAGLNFPNNCKYLDFKEGKNNIYPFDLIPYILGKCSSAKEAKEEFENMNIFIDDKLSKFPTSPLHWMIADKKYCFVVEQTKDGMHIYDNPVGVLTNNPSFDWHLTNLKNYMNLTSDEATNRFSDDLDLKTFCKGMGALGLPGDLSSQSRFIRVAFTKFNAKDYKNSVKDIAQFFHILETANQTEGVAKAGKSYEKTVYTSCCSDDGNYHYTTYFNPQINCVDLFNENLDSKELINYKLKTHTTINKQN